ncbi:PepSY domain-containing protein [Bradyrhizobium sp. STM 3562]|uniref:PepSY domain-containing protein n=1 Tax=Bradyrhizobium sp. STM 3562 TaxID=578924 RepID=UPI003890C1C3
MSNKCLVAALFLSLASVAASPAMADLAVSPAATSHEGGTNLDITAVTIDRELERFRAAEVSLRRAMAIAETLHKGARAADISFDGEPTSPVYWVTTVKNDQIWKDAIDAKTGEVSANGTALSLKELGLEDRSNLSALKSVRQDLSDAVLVAEKSASGKAISGGLTNEGGKLNFIVVVVSGDDLKQVVLEPPRSRRGGSARRRSP